MPNLPEFILEAVTRSACVNGVNKGGSVVWDLDALNMLQDSLLRMFREAAQDETIKGEWIMLALTMGTGVKLAKKKTKPK